ncbi:hypothetical protein YC2023_094000 [Brassica napus]
MLTNVLVNAKYLEQPMQLDWPFDSGRKKTYLSLERGQRTPKYSDRLWKKVESWCKANKTNPRFICSDIGCLRRVAKEERKKMGTKADERCKKILQEMLWGLTRAGMVAYFEVLVVVVAGVG